MEFSEELLVPRERIAVLIGKKGASKRSIARHGKVKLTISSKEHTVLIAAQDILSLMNAKRVITAVARGFSPTVAQKLFKEEYSLEIINITDYCKKSKKDLERLRGRVIGEQGKSKNIIQRYTNTDIVIYGKTVGVIGQYDDIGRARIAIEKLLSGRKHATVYDFLMKRGRYTGGNENG